MAMPAPLPANEHQRLLSLSSYDILDTPREAAFEDVTCIAAQICQTPMALISLVDLTRQWFKSAVGLDAAETPRDVSFCAHAILGSDMFVVPDAALDPRFRDNALVTGAPFLRFYAGAVLHSLEGYKLGTLCVLDRAPRQLEDGQRAALEALARQTMVQLELRRALRATERVNRYRSRVMAVAAHDLKQPVNIVHMALDTLSQRLASEDDRQVLGYAASAIAKLNSELDALALASRLDQESLRVDSFPIDRVLESTRDNWTLRAKRKGLRLKVRACNATVRTDETMLSTIIGNLVGNAIKYTDRGGVLVGCRRRGDALVIEVSDTGRGIEEDQLAAIFNSFHQLDGAAEGLGLGLAIVKRTAELLGYDLDVVSRPGRGSRFSVAIRPPSPLR
jgi:signal transduction histidine kinase